MLVLVDTSVWVAHWRSPIVEMARLLQAQDVVTHSVVIGELAVGNLHDRSQVLADLRTLLDVIECRPSKVLDFIESNRLFGLGLSWGDVQLLAAAGLNRIPIWTIDQRLQQAALSRHLAYAP